MVKKIKLAGKTRSEKNGNAAKVRHDGYIPAVVYGPEVKNRAVKVKRLDFENVYEQAGESNLIDFAIDSEAPVKILVKDVQVNPVKDQIIHADFYQVDMKQKIEVEIPLNFIGEAKAVRELGGTLVKNLDTIEVKCLPGDLVDSIDVDISVLTTFDDHIKVKDLAVPQNLEVLNHADDTVANVLEQREEIEPEPVAEGTAGEAAAGEGEKAGEEEKKEGEKSDKKE